MPHTDKKLKDNTVKETEGQDPEDTDAPLDYFHLTEPEETSPHPGNNKNFEMQQFTKTASKFGQLAPEVTMAQTQNNKKDSAARVDRAHAHIQLKQRMAAVQVANAAAIKQHLEAAKRQRLHGQATVLETELTVRERVAAARTRANAAAQPDKIKHGGAIYTRVAQPELRTAEIKGTLSVRRAAMQKQRIDALSAKLATRRVVQERLAALKQKVASVVTDEAPSFIRVAGQVFEKIVETAPETTSEQPKVASTGEAPPFIRVNGKVFARDEARTAEFRAAQTKSAETEAPNMIRVAGKLYMRED
jgi:hypothetical protein